MSRETTNRSGSGSGTRSRSGNARRKSARVKRRQRVITVIVIAILVILLIAAILISTGIHLYKQWEARFDSDTSVVFILEDDKIVSNDVVAFDTNKYSQTELMSFIEETISTYNLENGEDSVVQESFEMIGNNASLILTYADAKTYEDFSGTELFVGTIAEAVAAGYTFDGQFASLVDGNAVACTVDKFYGQTDLKVAIIKANTKISVEGDIMYLSSANVADFGENWIVTRDGYDLLESGKTEDSQPTEGTETETGTDTEQTDGSVDGTELVTEETETETSTEIIFDFGDEEEIPVVESTYSEVYTYIIYR